MWTSLIYFFRDQFHDHHREPHNLRAERWERGIRLRVCSARIQRVHPKCITFVFNSLSANRWYLAVVIINSLFGLFCCLHLTPARMKILQRGTWRQWQYCCWKFEAVLCLNKLVLIIFFMESDAWIKLLHPSQSCGVENKYFRNYGKRISLSIGESQKNTAKRGKKRSD